MAVNWRAFWDNVVETAKHPGYYIPLTIGIAIAGALMVLVSVLAFGLALAGALVLPFIPFWLHRIFLAKKGWIYEILSLEESWEIHDESGARVTLKKMVDVQFLRDRVTTISDPAWGDGDLFAEYYCTPGRYVGTGQSGERRYAVIMLDPPRRRGDIEHFELTRVITGGFTRRDEWVEVDSETCTGPLKISVVFPPNRPPQSCSWSRRGANKEKQGGQTGFRRLEDERVVCYIRVGRPSPDDVYRLTWTW